MMKVAMVTPWNVRCGIFTYTEKLAYALAEQDVEVYIVRLPRFGVKNAAIIQDVAVRACGAKDVDLIHVQHEYGLYQNFEEAFYGQLRASGKPILTTMHAVGKWDTDEPIAKVSARVIVHNKFCKKRFPYPNTVIISHGATPAKPTLMEDAKKSWGIDPKTPIVGYLGFISNYKGVETLIEAMMKVRKVGLLMCGGWHVEMETDYINKIKEWSLQVLPNRVQWTGFVPDERLADAYGAMDIVVYPSRYTTESGALITALSYGKAVIAGDLAPFKEKEQEGALVTFKSVPGLTRKIRHLLKDNELRRKLEENAKKYAERTSWPVIAEKHVALYKEVLKGSSPL